MTMNLPKQPQALEADVKGAVGIGVLGHALRGAAGIEELAFPVFYAGENVIACVVNFIIRAHS